MQDFTGAALTMSSQEQTYIFDLSEATLECEDGMITGDEISVIYEGQLSSEDTSTVKALKVVDDFHKKNQLEVRKAYGEVQGLTPNTITIKDEQGKTATYPITGTEQYYQGGIRQGALADRWLEEIRKYLPERKENTLDSEENGNKEVGMSLKKPHNGKLRILDVGCGTGFFTILLAKQGHQVTGTDLTPDMVANSRILAKEEQVNCNFEIMDAEHLSFADNSFDVVISRNLTWTLPEAAQAYKEWTRVLKPGG